MKLRHAFIISKVPERNDRYSWWFTEPLSLPHHHRPNLINPRHLDLCVQLCDSLALLMPVYVRVCVCVCVYLPLSSSFRPSWSANWTSAAVCILTKALAHSCTAASARPAALLFPRTRAGARRRTHHAIHTLPTGLLPSPTPLTWPYGSRGKLTDGPCVKTWWMWTSPWPSGEAFQHSHQQRHTGLYLWDASGRTTLLRPRRDGDERWFDYD